MLMKITSLRRRHKRRDRREQRSVTTNTDKRGQESLKTCFYSIAKRDIK